MSRQQWKAAEDRLARLFGSVRRPLSGMNSRSGGRDDAMHPRLFLENKYGNQCQSIWKLYRESRRLADQSKRTLVIGLQGKNAKGIILVMHDSDLLRIAVEYAAASIAARNQLETLMKDILPPKKAPTPRAS
jgi:hypothetical protein